MLRNAIADPSILHGKTLPAGTCFEFVNPCRQKRRQMQFQPGCIYTFLGRSSGHKHIGYPMAVLCLLTMTDTLAARETHGKHKHTYNHTGGACLAREEAVPTERLRLREQINIHCPSKAPRGALVDKVSSVHKCGSSGTVRCVQMVGELCVVTGPNGLGGFE